MRFSKNIGPVAVAVLLALSFAFMGVWIRMLAGSFTTYQQVYLRILIAGVLAAVVFRKQVAGIKLNRLSARHWWIYALRAFLGYTVGVLVYTFAIEHSKLSTVSFISSLPIMGLLAWLMFRERLEATTLPLVGFSVIGLLLLTGFSFTGFSFGAGELAAMVALLGFDLGFLLSKSHHSSMSNVQSTTILLLLGWIPAFVLSLAHGEAFNVGQVTWQGWVGLTMSSVLNVVGLMAVNYVFAHMKAYVAGNIFLVEGVFSSVLGLVFYHELPTATGMIGALIIVACALGISLIDAKKRIATPAVDVLVD
jgi:drug/metabolite transporter (DMT)-like permease